MKIFRKTLFPILLLGLSALLSPAQQRGSSQYYRQFLPITQALNGYLSPIAAATGVLRITDVKINDQRKTIDITYNSTLSEYPFRKEIVDSLYSLAVPLLPPSYKGYKLRILSGGNEISNWIPKYYKEEIPVNAKTDSKIEIGETVTPLVTRISQPFSVEHGLQKRHIALWQSHGYYYAQNVERWEWQRTRLFQTVEDIYTSSYILPFLVPMLENAGAVVLLPRERDIQINEVIVDNDSPTALYFETSGVKPWTTPADSGFAHTKPIYTDGENPFRMGSYRMAETAVLDSTTIEGFHSSHAVWLPDIPESGSYAVYVSYKSLPNSASDALYTVFHKGGKTCFKVNQTMGGGTWIYLGHFEFEEGISNQGKVELTNISLSKDRVITADAVKFGGGMGNIGRSPPPSPEASDQPTISLFDYPLMISTYPRFTEGSRYWLQWAGAPDSVYTPNLGRNDYNDDYMSRGRWVNYISGSSSVNAIQEGLGIPIDLSLAFHTDAGVTLTDSIVGTLGIYTSISEGSTLLADGRSRFISRDFTDLVQSQVVSDIRATFEPNWMRRGIWDRSYAESRAPNVPAMLLELLSHQNFADMRYGLDPNFRFTVSRAVYKGILRFLGSMEGISYVVQPLPVEGLSLTFASENEALLRWQATDDPLEPNARAQSYVVYTRKENEAFDNGIIVNSNSLKIRIKHGITYSFKVTAVNSGGQSFPSEILSIHKVQNERGKVLIVNGFDRISAPADFASKDSLFGGFLDGVDYGVPYLNDISFVGRQYDHRRNSLYVSNDSPGFGASYSTYETKVLAGNSFDYPVVHGNAFALEGYSYASCSQKAFMNDNNLTIDYDVVDLILGKQRQTITGTGFSGVRYTAFPHLLQKRLTQFCHSGGNLLVSGSYVASDIWDVPHVDSTSIQFATNVLKYRWVTGHASQIGEVKPSPSPLINLFDNNYSFYTLPNGASYWVDAPDAISPSNYNAYTIFRYTDGNKGAGIAYSGDDYKTVVLGFPIETIIDSSNRHTLIKSIMRFFDITQNNNQPDNMQVIN